MNHALLRSARCTYVYVPFIFVVIATRSARVSSVSNLQLQEFQHNAETGDGPTISPTYENISDDAENFRPCNFWTEITNPRSAFPNLLV